MQLRHSRTAAVVALGVCLSLLVAAVAGPAVALSSGTPTALSPAADSPALAQEQPIADTTVTRIELSENGTARWTVQIRTALDSQERVEEYRAFQSRFRANTSQYLDPFRTRITGTVRTAANETGREMRATDFAASTTIQEVPRRWGIVTYEFTWTNFAVADGEDVTIGDVFGSGFFLAAGDTLELRAPAGYEFTTVDPEADQREPGLVAWVGRTDFAVDHPQATAVATDGADSPAGGDNGSTERPNGLTWLPAVAVGLLLLAVGVGGVVWYRRRASGVGPSAATPSASSAGTTTPAASPPSGDGRDSSDADGTDGTDDADDVGDADDADDTDDVGDADDAADTDDIGDTGDESGTAAGPTGDELLTDSDRVRRLLDGAGGRMKQADVADELDWSASKTSRVVADMADEGLVRKLRLGRENVLELVGESED
ncbi:hypothetical protein SAMN04487949_0224 [Halogranum gelatinilyticum]|uniref:IclR helix-turn-helix domain-containing protein n=1 Tax=Halogranum gelatinilyticum TaxID=660521 RepID=A0A1G9P3Q3_9EURY|nr:helix-turn-helix domain-containing protein [Halogranum gelatinilyticum]SDL93344.1 hypothetical protein SAMN04487949_0224 [Halogranum gelatinilyticum]